MDSPPRNEIEDLEDIALDDKIERTKRLLASTRIASLSDNGQKLKPYLLRLLAERERRNQSPQQKIRNGIEGLEDSALDLKIERTKTLMASPRIASLSDNGQNLKLYLQSLLAERERRNQSSQQKAETDKAVTARRSEKKENLKQQSSRMNNKRVLMQVGLKVVKDHIAKQKVELDELKARVKLLESKHPAALAVSPRVDSAGSFFNKPPTFH